ncbi:unnamed protein product [Brachionus calyciflorus]|uniref:TLC domain-containing protein n=1 Tax=Brachionus calyciflorus TaxID=104777 RepID=A0A813X716_9BILA|nr:unnamed protein product [Brachionus calyciflorus]
MVHKSNDQKFRELKNVTEQATSVLVIINVYQSPELLHDMINVSTKFSYIVICISKGYFMYDAIDILYSNKKLSSQSKEVLLHHGLIIFIFSITLSLNRYVGYTIGALSIEFNTVFLHLRFLTLFCNVDRNSIFFRIILLLNLLTFIIFRFMTLGWMTRWIILNRNLIPFHWFTVGSIGLIIMGIINLFLFKRLLQTDFSKNSTISVPNGTESTKKSN